MSEAVLDSSVILAIAKNEHIDAAASRLVDGGVMSAVNVAEVYTKLAELALSVRSVEAVLATLARIEPFTFEQARLTGDLRGKTRHVGLSLGDRACLALALKTGGVAYTVDRHWAKADVGCEIRLLR